MSKPLSLIAPVTNRTSYGLSAINIALQLRRAGSYVSLFPLGTVEVLPKEAEEIAEMVENSRFYELDAPSIRMYHQHDLTLFAGRGERIGWPIFEVDGFSTHEKHQLESCDRLIVCSDWAKEVLERHLNICPEVNVVPLGVDISLFQPKASLRGETVFLNVGKWEYRKGHDVLMEWFADAFTEEDNVELWLAPEGGISPPSARKRFESLYHNNPLRSKIHILNYLPTQEHVAAVMQQADIGVFPSRAEGWNLPVLEMLSCGKRVIVTNRTAHTQYCNETTAIDAIDVQGDESAIDSDWPYNFDGRGTWSKLDNDTKDQFISSMRSLHKKKQEQGSIIDNDAVSTAEKFTWEKSASQLLEIL